MSEVISGAAPAFDGPVVCTLPLEEVGGRLKGFREVVFRRLRAMERPGPNRLRLVLAGEARAAEVRELLVREQRCCPFLAFTIAPQQGRVLVELEVREEAAPVLDGLARLAALAAPEAAR
jgi:MerR family transcriptional regulator, copper efflux regulator